MTTKRKEIAVGMDGCVFKPAFSCMEGHQYPSEPYISKLMIQGRPKVDAEIANYQRLGLNDLDPEMQYFISQPELCNLSPDDIESFRLSKENCKDVAVPYTATNYLDSGTDLFMLIAGVYDRYERGEHVSLNELNNYLFAFNNVMQGVLLLNDRNILHLDIKPDNIVMNTADPNADFKLIDFAMSRNVLENPPTSTFGTPTYIPPEMYMFATPRYTIKDRYVDFFTKVAPTFPMPIPKENIPPLAYYEAMPAEEKYGKVDVWALGMTLHDMYTMILAGNYPPERLQIYGELKTQIIDEMLNLDVERRLNIQEAAEFYNDFVNALMQEPQEEEEISGGRRIKRIKRIKRTKRTKRSGFIRKRTNKIKMTKRTNKKTNKKTNNKKTRKNN
jgi:serine/threonine protein kinase